LRLSVFLPPAKKDAKPQAAVTTTILTVDPPTLYTVGHSTRSLDAFVDLLKRHGVTAIADVRRFPKSRKYPHFNDDALALSLPERGLTYTPVPLLGGRRRARPDSPNTGWRNEGFRGYADYTMTEPFAQGLEQLLTLAAGAPTAMMCAEAVPWRCHRSLIADAALVRGWRVLDVVGDAAPTPHKLTKFARVEGTRITYPPEAETEADATRAGLIDAPQ
jgi:uncharacterized protein (DUF488 family)